MCENHHHLGHRSDFEPLSKRFLSRKSKIDNKNGIKKSPLRAPTPPEITHRNFLDNEMIDQIIINHYDFSTIITNHKESLKISHIPLVYEQSNDDSKILLGHVARSNDHWIAMKENGKTTAIFHGPHAYIPPLWYVRKNKVPTWNYVSIHFYFSFFASFFL